ncbi:MAG: hypothetical protein J5590_03990 [Clostridia bacterium]|nr:hypothetical protein [Clostridia bacterium]
MKKLIALLMSFVFVLSFSGCGSKGNLGKDKENGGQSEGLATNFNEEADNYETIDEMPDYEGDVLDLIVWYGTGTGDVYKNSVATDDKFRAEIERVTGVRISDQSYDNNGKTADQVVSEIAASGDYPHVSMGLETSIAEDFIDHGYFYDLTDYIPQFMPHYDAVIHSDPEVERQWKNTQGDKGTFAIKRFHTRAFQFTDPEGYEAGKYRPVLQPVDSRNYFWIRDDILKKIHPEAKTQAEIKDIFMKNGEFTQADMTDFVIKDKDEFRKLLEDIKALNIEEDGKKVWPFYTRAGVDDYWDLLTMFGIPLAGGGAEGLGGDVVSDYTYYDGEKDSMVVTAEQEWFKDICWFFDQLVIDGLSSKDALADDDSAFQAKLKNGEYAIVYGNQLPPSDDELKTSGKNYAYRKVMIDIPCDYNKFVRRNESKNVFDAHNMYVYTSMTPTEVEHFLRFIDFFYTEPGMKLANWGPEKAGMYEVDENGKMRYTDERYEAAQLLGGDPKVYEDYGLYSFPRIDYFVQNKGINKYQPALEYADEETEAQESDWEKAWNYANFEPLPDFPFTYFAWQIYSFNKYSESVKDFWNQRDANEEAFGRLFAAKDRAEFDSLYEKLLTTFHENGLDENGINEMNEVLKERCDDSYQDLADWSTDAAEKPAA